MGSKCCSIEKVPQNEVINEPITQGATAEIKIDEQNTEQIVDEKTPQCDQFDNSPHFFRWKFENEKNQYYNTGDDYIPPGLSINSDRISDFGSGSIIELPQETKELSLQKLGDHLEQTKKTQVVDQIKHENLFTNLHRGKITDFYELKNVLGQGAFGQVYKVIHKKSKLERAMKSIKKKSIKDHQRGKLMEEMTILKELDHPNILRVYDLYQDSDNYYLITEQHYFDLKIK